MLDSKDRGPLLKDLNSDSQARSSFVILCVSTCQSLEWGKKQTEILVTLSEGQESGPTVYILHSPLPANLRNFSRSESMDLNNAFVMVIASLITLAGGKLTEGTLNLPLVPFLNFKSLLLLASSLMGCLQVCFFKLCKVRSLDTKYMVEMTIFGSFNTLPSWMQLQRRLFKTPVAKPLFWTTQWIGIFLVCRWPANTAGKAWGDAAGQTPCSWQTCRADSDSCSKEVSILLWLVSQLTASFFIICLWQIDSDWKGLQYRMNTAISFIRVYDTKFKACTECMKGVWKGGICRLLAESRENGIDGVKRVSAQTLKTYAQGCFQDCTCLQKASLENSSTCTIKFHISE